MNEPTMKEIEDAIKGQPGDEWQDAGGDRPISINISAWRRVAALSQQKRDAMASPIYEERQKRKRLNIQYRKAAARIYGAKERENRFGEVKQMSGGAFVELTVWIPLDEAAKESAEE